MILEFTFFGLLLPALASAPDPVPRRFVPYDSDNNRTFHEEGVLDYSTMLLREDLGLLMVGASGMVYALDLNDITKKNDSVQWDVPPAEVTACGFKGNDPVIHCRNQIKTLLKRQDNKMYVCGTNAFNPKFDYMSYNDGKLTLENQIKSGKGRCPYDPFERSASLMLDNDLYSATSVNFRATESVLMRRSTTFIRTDYRRSWFYDPEFVSLEMMPESQNSVTGDDDKIYLFFSETAMEYDSYKQVLVSRVARVCKGDHGGLRTLQDKWTSFVKATLECPVPDSKLPYIIQDTFRWCDPQKDWKSCLFFAVFTSQTSSREISAVCAYRVSEISRVLAEGRFMTEGLVNGIHSKWVLHNGILPVPRPGSCIDDAARNASITQSSDLPGKTLLFIQKNTLIGEPIMPIGKKTLLIRKGIKFTRIVIDQVQSVDGDNHHVMFIGTEGGTIVKAVNYDGEMFVIEEVQVFKTSEPIKILKFSNVTRQIYAGSDSGVVQMSLSSCGRSLTCMDCVLARDPYCGWDHAAGKCSTLSATQRDLIQSVIDGNASLCPQGASFSAPVQKVIQAKPDLGSLKLPCSTESMLATIMWEKDGVPLVPSSQHLHQQDGLLIISVSHADTGNYSCLSVELSKGDEYSTTVVQYNVVTLDFEESESQNNDAISIVKNVVLVLLSMFLLGLLTWNIFKGHLFKSLSCRRSRQQTPAVFIIQV